MHNKKPTEMELYMEAIRQLEIAAGELDQAHATLRSIDMENYSTSHINGTRLTVGNLSNHAASLLKDLKAADCDECGALVLLHPIDGCSAWRK